MATLWRWNVQLRVLVWALSETLGGLFLPHWTFLTLKRWSVDGKQKALCHKTQFKQLSLGLHCDRDVETAHPSRIWLPTLCQIVLVSSLLFFFVCEIKAGILLSVLKSSGGKEHWCLNLDYWQLCLFNMLCWDTAAESVWHLTEAWKCAFNATI